MIRDEHVSWRRIFGLAGLAVLITALAAFAGLRYVASETHQEEPTVTGSMQPAPQTRPSAPTRTAPATPPAAQPHNDGHGH
ncbi:hypothetical protein AB0D94_34310 [Streptomyces sp. NPDC048255]|uniref:hypothetical protein n=1 Tax=Streptomyces sp. NPDC048255 TaxID=3154713 RepID=UPI0033FD83F9